MISGDSALVRLPPVRTLLLIYGLGLGVAMAGSGALAWRQGAAEFRAVALGWAVAVAGAAAGLLIKRRALSGDLTRFLLWGLLVNFGRAGIFLLIIVAVYQSGMQPFRPFLVGVLSVYFGCMASEIWILHALSAEKQVG